MQLVMGVRRSRIAARWSLAVVSCVILFAGCAADDAWSRGRVDLVASLTTSTDADWPYLNAHDVTASVCGQVTDCLQAVRSDYVTVLKFGSSADAAAYTGTLGTSGVHIDPLVIHFDGEPISDQARQEVIEAVKGINASSPD